MTVDARALAVVLGKIQRIADREVAEGRVPSHVLDRNPQPAQAWVLVSTYAALALDMLTEVARQPSPTGFPVIDAHTRMYELAIIIQGFGHRATASRLRDLADEMLKAAIQ